jgi:hypothetical protein
VVVDPRVDISTLTVFNLELDVFRLDLTIDALDEHVTIHRTLHSVSAVFVDDVTICHERVVVGVLSTSSAVV